jgi:hypothetical protein
MEHPACDETRYQRSGDDAVESPSRHVWSVAFSPDRFSSISLFPNLSIPSGYPVIGVTRGFPVNLRI